MAHVIFNDGITSKVIKDTRNFIPNIRNELKIINTKVIDKSSVIRNRKRKWISYDRLDKKLKVVGSDVGSPTIDEILVTITDGSDNYLIKEFVGIE